MTIGGQPVSGGMMGGMHGGQGAGDDGKRLDGLLTATTDWNSRSPLPERQPGSDLVPLPGRRACEVS